MLEKSVLDSLLRPYYKTSIDLFTEEIVYTSRFRVKVNKDQDTSYVPLPKKNRYIEVTYRNKIEPLEINTTVDSVHIRYFKKAKEPDWWITANSIGLDINQIAFINWSSGGENSISGLLKVYLKRDFEKLYTLWKNELSIRYGMNNIQDKGLIKTDDAIKISSTFGYRKNELSNWYYSAKFNFATQFTDGYKYPNTDDPISRFFAPAYLYFGLGSQYNLEEKHFSIYFSPATLKSTFVLDKTLSDEGAFGVEKGKRSRHELGMAIQSSWDVEIFKNVAMRNRLGLYTDYINNFGNVDVNWELAFKFKINKFFEANIGSQLVYDDDIKHKEDINGDGELETVGPRVQFKQQLGIGILYKF
ncbi:MAG: DUF3078 domain-containing protein [Flavobacteriaceae bacterium]|nr:DUF3078 domain-containing protein [Flavobacteriaceae bacterium]